MRSLHAILRRARRSPRPVCVGTELAALYGLRFVHPWRLDLGWMQVSHGSLNAVGFALATLLGWRRAEG